MLDDITFRAPQAMTSTDQPFLVQHHQFQTGCHGRPQTTLWVVVEAHMFHNHIPHLRSRVALLEILVIIPHQLTVRFRYNCLLRARVHRGSAVEMKP